MIFFYFFFFISFVVFPTDTKPKMKIYEKKKTKKNENTIHKPELLRFAVLERAHAD